METFSKSILSLILLFCLFGCQEKDGSNIICENQSISDVGFYHNEILKNYETISKTPSTLSTKSEVDEYIKLLADYGASVKLAYRNDPPSSNLDLWVGDVLNQSLTIRQRNIINNITLNGMSMTAAVNNGFNSNVVSTIISEYLSEIESILERYGGSASCESKLALAHLTYYRTASSEERQLASWIGDVTDGSYEYWDTEHGSWNPAMQGRIWDDVKRSGKILLSADIAGAVEYFLGTKIGLIVGVLSWKTCAAYAALNSIVAGVATLIDGSTRSVELVKIPSEVDYNAVYDAYLIRVKELGI